MPVFGHTFFGLNLAIFGPILIGLKMFKGAYETIIYRWRREIQIIMLIFHFGWTFCVNQYLEIVFSNILGVTPPHINK